MIDLNKYLNTEVIIPDLRSNTREGCMKELITKIFEDMTDDERPGISAEDVFKAVMSRENMQTTGIGNSLAVPHARIEGWKDFSMAMGVSKEGIDFDGIDGKPAKFIFLMISSPDEPYIILQAMSAIVRFMTDLGIESGLLDDPANFQQILDNFLAKDIKADDRIKASDIARPVSDVVMTTDSLEESARTMHLKRKDSLPVVDADGKLCGEISCCDIFEFGIPDFFKQLNTISFVRHIDPFEKYFRIKKDLRVGDVYRHDTEGMKKDSTLLEMIFEMTVKNKAQIFVVDDDGVLSGIVDRFCIIDKILFF